MYFTAKYAGERRTEPKFRSKIDKTEKESDKNMRVKQMPGVEQKKIVSFAENEVPDTDNKGKLITINNIAMPYAAIKQGETVLIERDSLFSLPGDTLYEVQLLTLHTPINIDNYFALLLSKIPGLKIREVQGEDGIYRYTAQIFSSLEKARKLNALIRQSGWVDSFITTYFVIEKRN